MRGNRRINNLLPVRLQCFQRANLVGSHKAAITSDICRQYRRQPPLDIPTGHEAPGLPAVCESIKSWRLAPCQRKACTMTFEMGHSRLNRSLAGYLISALSRKPVAQQQNDAKRQPQPSPIEKRRQPLTFLTATSDVLRTLLEVVV